MAILSLVKACLGFFTKANEAVVTAVESAGIHISLAKFVTGIVAMVPTQIVASYMPKGNARHIFGALSTAGLLFFSYGRDLEQFVYAGALVYFFMRVFPKKCGYLTWGTIFSYQIYLHYERSSEAAWSNGNIDFTGSFMMIVLKLISIAMDYQDGMTGKKTKHSFNKMPSVLEYAGYLGGLNGIMVGPHFYYDEYMQYANNLGVYETMGTSKFPNTTFPAIRAFCCSILCAGLFAVSTTYIPRTAVMFGNNPDMSMIKRIPISILANMGYRARFYFAWLMAESAYIFSGFGFSGYDEEGKPTWTRAINAPLRRIEFSPSAAYVVTQWNIHTGQWLRYYIYDRLGGAGFWPLLVTQVISGIWHGFTAGYVVFFINSAIMIHASRMLYRIQKEYLPKKYNKIANEVHRVHTLYNLNYVSGSYAAGNIYRCLGWFSSQYYFGHIEMLGVIAVVTLFFPSKKKKLQKLKADEAPATADEAEQKKAK